jgi:serine/threonine-protein kinase HipA
LTCLEDLGSSSRRRHEACARALFGSTIPPRIDLDLARLHTFGLAMVGRLSLSGVQKKISLRVDGERETLRLEVGGGSFILKPQAGTFPNLPENEHVTMRIAHRAGVEVAPNGLIELNDGSLAYLTRRFDRFVDPTSGALRKRAAEDFCQLAMKSPKEKYEGSTELLFRLVHRFATEPLLEVLALFRLVVVIWWTGNDDAHLKNFMLVEDDAGRHRLAPVFDLLNTRLVLPDGDLALSLGGKKSGLTRRSFLELADYARLPRKAAERELRRIVAARSDALELVARSFLPDPMKRDYIALLTERGAILTEAG